jgi:molybdenum cofactor cytidylyltransferase
VIAAILLAAGVARRFGGPKLLQDLAGKPVVRWSAEGLSGAPVDEIVVVVPPAHEAIRRALAGGGLRVRFVVNPNPDEGMGASVACGIAALAPGTGAALVALADEPRSSREALMRVVERYRAGGAAIVVPRYHGTRGHPVLFDQSVFQELRALSGDQGARSVTDRNRERVAFVDIDAPQPVDIDTPQDLQLLRSTEQGRDWLIDRLMPEFDERASYGIDVAAPPDAVYRALLETNLADSLVSRILLKIRALGRGSAGALRLRDLPERGSFFRLADDPPREIVIGVVGRFWALRGNVCDGDAASFRAPPAAGTAKAAWNFRVDPTDGGSRLTTETRVLCADDESRRSFRRYWTVVGPFSGIIRLEALRLIRRQAQFTSSPPHGLL